MACESSDHVAPPELNIILQTQKIVSTPYGWSSDEIKSELPTDILLITASDHGFNACYCYMKQVRRGFCQELGFVDFGKFGDQGIENLRVALIKCAQQQDSALVTVKNAADILNPKVVLFVGVCASMKPMKAKLGDVVISLEVAIYGNAKLGADSTIEYRGFRPNKSKNIARLILSAADGWEPPLQDQKSLNIELHRDATMLSCPDLVDSFQRKQELLNYFPDALGIEMDGAGLCAAVCDLIGIEWAVIKGVSNLEDGGKNDGWQTFASAMAASVVENIFKYPVVLQDWPHYRNESCSSTPIEEWVRKISGTTAGTRMYNGRTIEYFVSGRIHSLREPWVYDATAKDVATGETVEKKQFKTVDWAINGAIEELIKKLRERKLMTD